MPLKSKNFTILMGCDTFAPDVNGAARFTERLSAGLKERGIEVIVIAPAANKKRVGAFKEEVEGAQLTVHRLKSHKLWGHEWLRFVMPWVARKHAKELLDSVKPDAVHIQSHILVGRGLAIEAAKRGVRIIATNHVMPENILDLKKMPRFIQRPLLKILWKDADRILQRAKKVTTPTRKAANFLEANTSRRNVLPISCGLDSSVYDYELGEKKKKSLVFVGRLNQEKQIDVAIRALAIVRKDYDVTLEVVGGGDQRDNLERLAVDLGVEESVVWHGRVSDEKLRAVLTAGTVFVMPSIAELQSIATLEAMASGLPIIAANAMALPHLVHEAENGHLFVPGDSKDLANKVKTVLALQEDDYVAMQKASLSLVAEHDLNKTLDAFENLYRNA